jgi:hypothetical protein
MSMGYKRPGTSTTGQRSRKADTSELSSVADITTIRRSSRARQACLASDPDVGVHAPLVELVEDDCAELRKEWILLEPRRQHALGGHQQSSSRTEASFESDLPANLFADSPPLLVGNAMCNRAGSNTARLQQDQWAVADQRWRHTRCLTGARLGSDDNRTRSPKRFGDRIDVRIDGKGFEGRGS